MTDWCPENDGAYRAEMAAMYPVQNRKRIEELEAKLDDKEAECRHLCNQFVQLQAKLAECKKYRDAYAECDRIGTQAVRDLEAKLEKVMAAGVRVHNFYAHRENKDVYAVSDFIAVIAELKGQNDE